jgi:hypothetical protein
MLRNTYTYEMLPLETKFQSGGKLLHHSDLRGGVPLGEVSRYRKGKRDILVGTWNVRSLYRAGSLIYTGCPGKNVPDFGRMFLKLKYTDLTKNTYIQSLTVTEIITREKCDLLAVPRTVPDSRDLLPVHCACPPFSLQPAQAHSLYDCTCKVLGTLRTTTTLVRVFRYKFNRMALCHSDVN